MKVVFGEFYRYTRIGLHGNEYFHYTPGTPVQIVLGSNGSGKSSLLYALFPLPAQAEFFGPGGYARVQYEHLGKLYMTYSYFRNNKEMRHSLKVFENGDWVELNTGGTQRVQTELCKDIFGITPLIRQILLSKDRFSGMSPQARRELFTLMSDADYTYGFKVHRAVRERGRHVDGVIKFLRESVVSKTGLLIKDDERIVIEKDIERLENSIEKLQALRQPLPNDHATVEEQVQRTVKAIRSISDEILYFKIPYPNQPEHDPREIELQLTRNRETQRRLQADIAKLHEQHRELGDLAKDLSSVGGRDSDSIVNNIETIDKTTAELLFFLPERFREPVRNMEGKLETVYHTFVNVYPSLAEIFSKLADNSELRYSLAKQRELTAKASDLLKQSLDLQTRCNKAMQQIRHYEEHLRSDQVHCPKCNHSWFLGYDSAKHEQTKVEYENVRERLIAVEKETAENNEYLNEVLHFISTYRDFHQITTQTPDLEFLWSAMKESDLAFQYPRAALAIVQELHTGIENLRTLAGLHRQREKELASLELARSIDQRNAKELLGKLTVLEDEVSRLTQEALDIQHENTGLEQYLSAVEVFTSLGDDLTNLLGTLELQETSLIKREESLVISESISSLQRLLSAKVDILSTDENERATIMELQDRLFEHEASRTAIQALLKVLSPTEGIIARGLMGFINNFLGQMNKVVNSIWSYEMEILPCELEDSSKPDLNYRFPVRIHNQPKNLKDISEGSTGQMEIVDLAYRIVCIRYLGLEEIPLFLDEFGSGFDEHHQNAISHSIKAIIEQMGFEQTFVISHNKASWGGIASSQLVVMDHINMEIPDDIPLAPIERTVPA